MELTCWWNQLWIIFMNMKSITAAAAINQFNHLFSLRMRKERLIGLICCVSGPFRNAKVNEVNFWWRKGGWASQQWTNKLFICEWAEWVRPAAQFMKLIGWWLSLSGGLWAQQRQWLRQEKKTSQSTNLWMNVAESKEREWMKR